MERIQKIIARAGIASRRSAEKMIREGRVSVGGKIITELGTKADGEHDEIRVDGNLISQGRSKIYLLLNKPRGYLTTLDDPGGRPIVNDLIVGISERVFPVGRLDYDSEGLLLMTNDGDFAHRVQHPMFKVSKTYLAKVKGNITKKEFDVIKRGAKLEDGDFRPYDVSLDKRNKKSSWIKLTIFEGRNRVIRRFFDTLNYPVTRLIRIAIDDIYIDDLKQGEFRYLKSKEIKKLSLTKN
ncbi:MAG: rRNA pseudouridine synthase [Syntrophobacterales bacterium]|nr:MAG: rRNA pseudouridine synthase [Syntrophobacterales bacterium]